MNSDNATPEQLLQDADGAILHWQIPSDMQEAFDKALAEGRIRFDPATDCYVHPEAIEHGYGEYTMPKEYK